MLPEPVLSKQGMIPDRCMPPRCLKSSRFLVKTSTAAAWQRLLLLLTKQRRDFSRGAMDSEFVKLLSPALEPEREVEINICIFILPLQFPSGASPAQGRPLFVPGGFAGGISHHL